MVMLYYCFFYNDTATTEIYTYLPTLSLHDARPIYGGRKRIEHEAADRQRFRALDQDIGIFAAVDLERPQQGVGVIVHLEAVVLFEIGDRFGLLLKDDEPVRILERRDGPGRLVIVVQRLGRGDQRSAIFAAGARIGLDRKSTRLNSR